MTIFRYVDDVFVASRWFCPECVEFLIALIYAKTGGFDVVNDGLEVFNDFRVVNFLDLWCFMS